MPIWTILFVLSLLSIFFYLGQRLHSLLMSLCEMIYGSKWYQYPHIAQRYVLLMLMRAQEPFYISAYGIVKCDLETFLTARTSLLIYNISPIWEDYNDNEIKFIQNLHAGAQLDIYSAHYDAQCYWIEEKDDVSRFSSDPWLLSKTDLNVSSINKQSNFNNMFSLRWSWCTVRPKLKRSFLRFFS